jgi:hypothetical protein
VSRPCSYPLRRRLSLGNQQRKEPSHATSINATRKSPQSVSISARYEHSSDRIRSVGLLRIVLFEDCSAFTRVTACTLVLSPIRDTLSEGFSYFVTRLSIRRLGFAPTALSRRTPDGDIVCSDLPRKHNVRWRAEPITAPNA